LIAAGSPPNALRAHRFAQLMQQHEGALRVDVEVTADL
jgi:hypothetical protein